ADRMREEGQLSWPAFERKYLSREDGFKYEWVNGKVEKTRQSMNQYQLFILLNLRQHFDTLRDGGKINGALEQEIDTFFLETIHRRPDVAYFSPEQLARMAYGNNQVPSFVIEIISGTDAVNRVTKKLKNYREAGVKVIWQIFPELEEIHVYLGVQMTICREDDHCSAAPALPAFELSASKVFEKPPLPETTI
ncbi:MAG: Uma2 family endonuclease, partial [Sphingobacteriaceae bacterium]|nr:Uma2 family endonuclease [Cytophagaceae bacterium]